MVDLPRASSQDDGSTVVSTIWIFVALSILFVTARLFTRARIVQSLGLDDWLISLSLVSVCYEINLLTHRSIKKTPASQLLVLTNGI